MRKHPNGRVDQLEDRYLGMVEAPSSNLGTSTPLLLIEINGVDRAAKTVHLPIASVFGSARPPETNQSSCYRPLSFGSVAYGREYRKLR